LIDELRYMAHGGIKKIKVACFDMAGTTVDDMVEKAGYKDKLPLVISAYNDAFKKGDIEIPFDELNDCRGRDKIEVFREKVYLHRRDISSESDAEFQEHLSDINNNKFNPKWLSTKQKELVHYLHDKEFVPALLANISFIREMPGVSETFEYLKERGIFIATGSGFPPEVTDAINEKLGWRKKGLVDYATCGAKAGGGRPRPNMINDILVAAGLLPSGIDLSTKQPGFDYSILLKVGDTIKDIEEGKNVGAVTIAVSSGTQSVEKLVSLNPTAVLPNVASIPQYLENHGYFID
jgi:phosphoglycolate phosphatase-like HAD superfamily hydrolase